MRALKGTVSRSALQAPTSEASWEDFLRTAYVALRLAYYHTMSQIAEYTANDNRTQTGN